MMRWLIIFLVFSFSIIAQKKVIGFVDIELPKKGVFVFEKKAGKIQPVSVMRWDSLSWGLVFFRDTQKVVMSQAYGWFYAVRSKNSKYYEIYSGPELGDCVFLPRKAANGFKRNRKVLKEKHEGILQRDTNQKRLYFRPNEQSGYVTNLSTCECYEIIKMKGDWLKVKSGYGDYCCKVKDAGKYSGWIRWRNKDMILVNLKGWNIP